MTPPTSTASKLHHIHVDDLRARNYSELTRSTTDPSSSPLRAVVPRFAGSLARMKILKPILERFQRHTLTSTRTEQDKRCRFRSHTRHLSSLRAWFNGCPQKLLCYLIRPVNSDLPKLGTPRPPLSPPHQKRGPPFSTPDRSRLGLATTNNPAPLGVREEPILETFYSTASVAGTGRASPARTSDAERRTIHDPFGPRGREEQNHPDRQTSVVHDQPSTSNPLARRTPRGCQRTDAVPDQRRPEIRSNTRRLTNTSRYIDDSGIGKTRFLAICRHSDGTLMPNTARHPLHPSDAGPRQALTTTEILPPRSPIRKLRSNPRN